MLVDDVKAAILDVPDYPKPGILFKDITPVLADPLLFERVTRWMSGQWEGVTHIVGLEARGFLFGTPVMLYSGAKFVPARKAGKLPRAVKSIAYNLEYGNAVIEIHEDAIGPGDRVVIIDDLLATGGTAKAAADLCQHMGAEVVGATFLIELGFLNGRAMLDVPVKSLVVY